MVKALCHNKKYYFTMLRLLIILTLHWTVINAKNNCDNVTNSANGETINDLNSYCKDKPCINRYCLNSNTIFIRLNKTELCLTPQEISKVINKTLDFSIVDKVYKKDYTHGLKLSTKNLREDFKRISYSNQTKTNCTAKWIFGTDFFLLEDGSLLWDFPHQTPRYRVAPQGDFILELHMRSKKNGKWVGPVLAVKMLAPDKSEEEDHKHIFYNAIGMLVSSFFLIILFIIYSMFHELRNLAGLILMAYAASFAVGIFLEAVQILASLNKVFGRENCRYTSIFKYFALMASFFWMNVMSFDIWWTFRGSIKARPVNRRGVNHKFGMYCLYAFGVPFLMTVCATVIDVLELENMKDIIKPIFDSCMNSKYNTILYIYVPIIILVVANIILFAITTLNIWRLKRDSEKIINTSESWTNKRNKNRFYMYIRLSLITGVHWTLDIIDMLIDDNMPFWLQYITNTYNVLIGVFIFAMFICKKNVLLLIRVRFSIFKDLTKYVNPKKSTEISRTYNDKRNDTIALEPLSVQNEPNI